MTLASYQSSYKIAGFDRVNFVHDVTEAIPQDDSCRLLGIKFEADGVRVTGLVTIETIDERYTSRILQRLQTVRGLVSVQEIN